MKTLIPIILLFTVLFFQYCQQKVNVEKEKEAILQVLLNEGKKFTDYDLEAIAALHIQDETALRLEGGENVYYGWNEIQDLYKTYIDANRSNSQNNETENWINEKENVITKVLGTTAWSVCDNIWNWDVDGESQGFNNKQLTFLEKVEGEWKISCVAFIPITNIEQNLEVSTKYHELKPNDIDDILTNDFIGRNEKSRNTWTKENHMNYWTNNEGSAKDTIFQQVANGNWVATRFQRAMNWQGKDVEFEGMQFKRFEDGKIAEIWEYGDSKQVD